MVADDGQGFEPGTLSEEDGIGLLNLSSRMEALSGTMQVDSEPGKGTTTILEIPLKG